MITVQQLRRAKGIEGYYASALSEGASEYYASQRGVWYGYPGLTPYRGAPAKDFLTNLQSRFEQRFGLEGP